MKELSAMEDSNLENHLDAFNKDVDLSYLKKLKSHNFKILYLDAIIAPFAAE